MGWRDLVRKREERRVVEESDLPPRARQGTDALVTARLLPYFAVSAFIVFALVRHAWVNDQPLLLFVVVGMIAFGLAFAWRNSRAHRSKGRKERRGKREANSIRWEEPE